MFRIYSKKLFLQFWIGNQSHPINNFENSFINFTWSPICKIMILLIKFIFSSNINILELLLHKKNEKLHIIKKIHKNKIIKFKQIIYTRIIHILEKITWYKNLSRASTVKVNQILCLDFCLASAIVWSYLEIIFLK